MLRQTAMRRTFTLVRQADREPHCSTGRHSNKRTHLYPLNIVVVDPFEVARDALARLLHRKLPGCQIHTVSDHSLAADICTARKVDIMILDSVQGHLDTRDKMAAFTARLPDMKFVVMTAISGKEELVDLTSIRNVSLCRKPIMLHDLLRAIEH